MSDFQVETKEGKSQVQDRREASVEASAKPVAKQPMETITKEGALGGNAITKSE